MSKKGRSKTSWWIAAIILIVVAAAAGYLAYKTVSKTDPSPLAGKWLRSDGGYVLELSEAGPDGQLKAAYFNPRPINVAQASWKLQDDIMEVFVELRDVHYPGSTYTLNYDPATDRLEGLYFQAVQRQNFKVRFTRKK
jgi:hypothetical protein